MRHASLFSGIGGFDLAASWMGWENVFQVEIDPFCNKVLEKNFPNTKRHGDIKTFDPTPYAGTIDILTGGFPCQPFSTAGKRKGTDDNRHLWPEMLRVISVIRPTFVVAENVRGLLSIEEGVVFEQVCLDLETIGYEVQPIVVPACSLNAPHRRDRIWFIIHSKHDGLYGSKDRKGRDKGINGDEKGKVKVQQPKRSDSSRDVVTDSSDQRLQGHERRGTFVEGEGSSRSTAERSWDENWPEVAAEFCGVDDGVPNRVHRLKALGNAVVPQVAYEIFEFIEKHSDKTVKPSSVSNNCHQPSRLI